MKSTKQYIQKVPLAQCVPTNYQRSTSSSQVEKIVKEFDESKLGTLIVSLRDGNYHIVDGLHRSKALKALGYTHALCIVLTGLSYEQEAEYFRTQNRNKRIVITYDDFRAGIEAKNGKCMRIKAIVECNNFQIGQGGFSKIASIRALTRIVDDFGFETLNDTLYLIFHTWNGIPKASQSETLLGVAEFVHRYGKADFVERLGDKFSAIIYDYSEAMRVRNSIASSSARKKFCRVLVEHYNKGLRSNNKKRLIWGESK